MIGHVWAGKSTFCRYMAETYGYEIVSNDQIRKSLYPDPQYTSQESGHVYTVTEEKMYEALDQKKDIVLEAFMVTNRSRNFARRIVEENGGRYIQVELRWPDENELQRRIEARFDDVDRDSDGDRNVYMKLKALREESDDQNRLVIFNNGSIYELYRKIDEAMWGYM